MAGAVGGRVVLCALALAACGPSIEPAAKADIDGRMAALQSASGTIAAPPSFEPMPLVAGQWSEYKMIDDKGQPSFLTYKVLGEEGGAFWIETLHESYYGRTAQKMLIAFGSRSDPSQIEIRAVVTLDKHGNINPMPPGMMPMLQSMFKGVVSALVINWQGMPQESAAVPAGRFDGCSARAARRSGAPGRAPPTPGATRRFPLSGVVRSQGIDRPFTMELVAFGMSGATADF